MDEVESESSQPKRVCIRQEEDIETAPYFNEVKVGDSNQIIDDESCPESENVNLSKNNEQQTCFAKDAEPTTDFTEDAANYFTSKEFSISTKENLQEFKILDEAKSEDSGGDTSGDLDSHSEAEDIAEEDVETMLNEDMPEVFKAPPPTKAVPYVTKKKIILEDKDVNHWEVLPLDWLKIIHSCGMPIYLHKPSRVCTFSKPYFLGKGNARHHEIPLGAIPCLSYKMALEKEAKEKELANEYAEKLARGEIGPEEIPGKFKSLLNSCLRATNSVGVCNKQNNEPTLPVANHIDVTTKMVNSNIRADGVTNATSVADNTNHTGKINPEKIESSDSKKNLHKPPSSGHCMSESSINQDITEPSRLQIQSCSNSSVISGDLKSTTGSYNHQFVTGQPELTDNNELASNDTNLCKNDDNMINNPLPNNIECSSLKYDLSISNNKQNEVVSESKSTNDQNQCNHLSSKSIQLNQINSQPTTSLDTKEGNSSAGSSNMRCEPSNNAAKDGVKSLRRPVALPENIGLPPVRVEIPESNVQNHHLTHEQVNQYCSKLFKFNTINVLQFKHWQGRRKYTKARKMLQRPIMPEVTKVIAVPITTPEDENKDQGALGRRGRRREWVMNMNGRSYLSIFHEYVGRALQKQPVYKFEEIENATNPYKATVFIDEMQYGVGYGTSKRQAKAAAAKDSIQILIPEMRQKISDDEHGKINSNKKDFSFFDQVAIEDPRVADFCATTMEPSPHAILRTCLLRNFGTTDKQIHTEVEKLQRHNVQLTMQVGKHKATVVCKSKKAAKQRASQAILKKLHPQLENWGSLLRLYGSRSVKSCREKKEEEQQITLLQDKATVNKPNYAILNKLRDEMTKLAERDVAVAPIGTLMLEDDLPSHSSSDLNKVVL